MYLESINNSLSPDRLIFTSRRMMNLDYYNSLLKNTPKKKPIPPPRKSLTGACSHVKLRCYPPERKSIFTFDFEASIANHAHNKSVKDPGMEQDMGIKVEDPGGNEDVHGTLRTCGKDLIRRVPSPDYDLIRVQMEDITPNKSTSFQRGIQEVGKNSLEDSMIRMGPEWSVPQEYSSSPIVRELAESAEERPRPPSSSQYGSSITSVISSRNPNYIIQADKQVTLLEQIIRSHPIWYLQHIGRPTATHMLRHTEAGNFIVRASSRPGCMAISVRLPEGFDMDTDHYVVEYNGKGKAVRLECSPNTFRSLPLLLEHYCIHSEELQIGLRLPLAVTACKTTKELQSIALLGQDFWTSEMSIPRSVSRISHITSESTTSFMESQAEGDIDIYPAVHYAVNDAPRNRTLTKKRVCSGRNDPLRVSLIRGELKASANVTNGDSDTNSPPSKHDRQDSFHLTRSERRSQSVRNSSHKNANSSAVSGSSSTGRRSFLKNLFFGNDGQQKQSASHQLAQCQYFIPFDKDKVKSSRSAFNIGDLRREDCSSTKATTNHQNTTSIMRTFKPVSGYDEVVTTARVCPLPMRRERSDLCASSVVRLVKHTERSPGPSTMRQPMKPPQSAYDPQSLKNCVDELRRKRLQSTNEMLNAQLNSLDSENGQEEISMRQRNWTSWCQEGNLRREHRMSVPNLASESASVIAQTAKALKEKLGRKGDGELSTINEGLITPVIRRKQFNQMQQVVSLASSPQSSYGERNGDIATGGTIERGRDVLVALFDQRPSQSTDQSELSRRCTSERNRGGRESDLAWRRIKGSSDKKEIDSTTTFNRGSSFFINKPSCSWSVINTELKTKQKIAKVRPTPQNRLSPPKMTVSGSLVAVPSVSGEKPSEYAQLSDFSGIDLLKQENGVGFTHEEDNVSVAGTIFNEPWDSNVWENLLDLAGHGDEGFGGRKLTEAIQEEDSDSDRTIGSTRMNESEDELEDEHWLSTNGRRTLPSDRITNKAWEHDDMASGCGTMDSRTEGLLVETMKKAQGVRSPPHSLNSVGTILHLPRAISHYSQHIGSLDDLPLSLPLFSHDISGERKNNQVQESGASIQAYVERLAQDDTTVFGATLKRFIECTVESEEADPSVVLRNVRQFINGIKNYLVKHGEGELHNMIAEESSLLNANQILNIDAILESALHKILLKRVKPHLYHVMVREHSRASGLQALSANIVFVRGLSLMDLGFSNCDQIITPSTKELDQIKACLRKMQHHYSPLKKLENLLRAVSVVLASQSLQNEENADPLKKLPPADDLVRWLVYILARTSTVGCEVEAWYMWELLPQQMLTKGDAAYYLTALFSAVHVLKSIESIKKLAEKDHDMMTSIDLARQCCSPSPSSSDAFVKVAIPDEAAGCIRYATFPGVPQMTTGKLCRVIAHQQGITNPEDHGLYLIVNGYETCLMPQECPDAIRDDLRQAGKPHLFAYKRHDAKIGWPRQVMTTPG